jgi:AcrR family transcriptional regulator
MNSGPEMELKIVEAAIACIEKYGFQKVTVRRIAQEAGVNVAAINYYFRSKEQLMQRVLQTTLSNAFDWNDLGESDAYSAKERLAAILEHLTAGAQAYPEITRVHFVAPLLEKGGESVAYAKFSNFLERLYDDLRSRGALPDPWQLKLAVMQAATASVLFPDLFAGFAGRDLRDPLIRREYIERLVGRLL